uniref:Protein kinase domain-containing protein n=1 Tax=Noctiluca scintillans TaxID=2966 RepID=A0A7S1APJ8_NOCSC|mmetsp:Transcript_53218/g.142356  ORF Transcript_53218/g.142356 Transcript_53218/m.142356 type:complete len:369 (+) Transcript_53218:52-1158(+)
MGNSGGSRLHSTSLEIADVQCGTSVVVMGRYLMGLRREDVLGHGHSSIVRRAVQLDTSVEVAIKIYRTHGEPGSREERSILRMFRRQIDVLQELQRPWWRPPNTRFWHPTMAGKEPSELFLKLVDYSKDASGCAGMDSKERSLYVITELADYSLQDMLRARRRGELEISKDQVWSGAAAIILVVAALHAKGLVHLDLKPSNLMVCGGRLKLIDVDGCVAANTVLWKEDTSISYTPVYCSPEWARFVLSESPVQVKVAPCMDVWSVGVTIWELAVGHSVMSLQHDGLVAIHSRGAHRHLLKWLGGLESPPSMDSVAAVDPELHVFLRDWLLVPDCSLRRTLAECLCRPVMPSSQSLQSARPSVTTQSSM